MTRVGMVAEQVVLGTLVGGDDEDYLQTAVQALTPAAFSATAHQAVFRTVCDLYLEGVPVGLGSISERLQNLDRLGEVGGYGALTSLTHTVLTEPSSAPRQYLADMADQYTAHTRARDLRMIADQLGSDLTLDEAMTLVEDLFAAPSLTSTALPDIGTQMADLQERLRDSIANPQRFTGVPTGWEDLDGMHGNRQLIGGLRPGYLVLLGGRPGSGKTVAILDWIRAACQHRVSDNGPTMGVYFASTEMPTHEVLTRLTVSLTATVDHKTYTTRPWELSSTQMEQIENAMAEIAGWNLVVDDAAADVATISRHAAAARARFRSNGSDLHEIAQDYVQILRDSPGVTSPGERERLSNISTSLKLLAKKMEVPVVAAVQLSRETVDRAPRADDLKGSGQFEQDADLIIGLHRPYATDPAAADESGALPNDMTGLMLKFRHGQAGQVFKRDFSGEFMRTVEPSASTRRSIVQATQTENPDQQ